MEHAPEHEIVARGAFRRELQSRRLLPGAAAADDHLADVGRRDEDGLLGEFKADLAALDPAHEREGAVAILEADLDPLAEPRLDVGLDHNAVCGDVDDMDLMPLAAEQDRRRIRQVQVPVLAALIVRAGFLPRDRNGGEAGLLVVAPRLRDDKLRLAAGLDLRP
jgi:hypothetical protein